MPQKLYQTVYLTCVRQFSKACAVNIILSLYSIFLYRKWFVIFRKAYKNFLRPTQIEILKLNN